MRIERLASSPDRAGRYRVDFSDGSVMRLYRQTIEDFCLFSGRELDPTQMESLAAAAGEMSAKMRAVRIVSASSVSVSDLQQRLIHKGEDPRQAKAAVEWMESLDLLDDRKTARQIVSRCIAKGYGLSRAKQALYEKRIPKHLWDEVLEDYPDQFEEIQTYLSSHLSQQSDPKELRRAINALMRRGHSYHNIRRALDGLSIETDTLPEE